MTKEQYDLLMIGDLVKVDFPSNPPFHIAGKVENIDGAHFNLDIRANDQLYQNFSFQIVTFVSKGLHNKTKNEIFIEDIIGLVNNYKNQ